MAFTNNEHITVSVRAENLASCPVVSSYAYTLTTRDLFGRNLSAIINALDGKSDLSASITAQSTAFVYGETYTIIITAKDFAGNEMEPFEFEFKIEEGS